MADHCYLWVSCILWAWSLVTGQPCNSDHQILHESHLELQAQELTVINHQDVVQRIKQQIHREEPRTVPPTNGTSMPSSGHVVNSWQYFAGFVLLAVGISIVIALIAKCKLLQRNRASYHHHRLPDSHSVGSSRTEDVPDWGEAAMEVPYGRNQSISGAAGNHAEDDDGFIEDNYIEPNHDMQKEEEEEEEEPHFKL